MITSYFTQNDDETRYDPRTTSIPLVINFMS